MPRISIIGTAGRGSSIHQFNKDVYLRMYNKVLSILKEYPRPWNLISGGAAISDHLAISLFLSGNADNLTLYLPALWDQKRHLFYGNKNADTANYYHRLFSEKMGGSTLNGIQKAIDRGAIYHEVKEGFFARNLLVGDTDVLVAFGWEKGSFPKSAGTAHTWSNSSSRVKIYVNICEI